MKVKNSYIFIGNELNTEYENGNETLIIDITDSFCNCLKNTFNDLIFFEIDNKNEQYIDYKSAGKFTICFNDKKYDILFEYYNVSLNYYLNICVDYKLKINIALLEEIHEKIVLPGNCFDKNYISITSYDSISEYYCNLLYPKFNSLERNIRRLLYNVYILHYNKEYYRKAIKKEDFINEIKAIANREDTENQNKKIRMDKYAFDSIDYHGIEKILFEKCVRENDIIKVKDFLKKLNENDKEIKREEISRYIKMLTPESDWNRLFKGNDYKEDFEDLFKSIHECRNRVAHCKCINKDKYEVTKKNINIIEKAIKKAIKETENKEFANKNSEIINEVLLEFKNNMDKMFSNIKNIIKETVETITNINISNVK